MQELTEEAGFAEVHIQALQTSVTVPGRHPLTAVTGDHNIEQVTVPGNEHVHLWVESGMLSKAQCLAKMFTSHMSEGLGGFLTEA